MSPVEAAQRLAAEAGGIGPQPTLRPEVVPTPIIEKFSCGRQIRAWITEVRRVATPLCLTSREIVSYAISGLRGAA